MFSVIALEITRVPREFKTFRGAQVAAVRLTRQWESMTTVLDSNGMEVGETEFRTYNLPPLLGSKGQAWAPGDGIVYAKFYLTPREVLDVDRR